MLRQARVTLDRCWEVSTPDYFSAANFNVSDAHCRVGCLQNGVSFVTEALPGTHTLSTQRISARFRAEMSSRDLEATWPARRRLLVA
jgi:hypothetical protein